MGLKGGRAYFRRSRRIRNSLRPEINRAINQSLIVLQRRARQEVPVRTGRLQDSVQYEQFNDTRGILYAGVDYAEIVHDGGRGRRPNPYFTRTLNKEAERIELIIYKAINKVVNK